MKTQLLKIAGVLAVCSMFWLGSGCSKEPSTKRQDVERLVGLGWAAASDGKSREWVENKTIIFGSNGALLADFGWRCGQGGLTKEQAINEAWDIVSRN